MGENGAASGKTLGPGYFHVENFTHQGAFKGVSFSLRKGEILGFGGLVGAGRTALARSIFGIDPKDSGKIFFDEKEIKVSGPRDAINHKIAYLTEDRTLSGLFLKMAIRNNLIAPSLGNFTSGIDFLKRKKIDRYVTDKVEEFSITTSSISTKILNLSGGNQQKCLIAMWMGIKPRVLIFDEPTRGVDVGAREEVYRKLREFASKGTGIIMISSDLPELIGMCDRILVMHQGRITGEVIREDFSEEIILSLAAGLIGRVIPCFHRGCGRARFISGHSRILIDPCRPSRSFWCRSGQRQ